MCQDPSLSRLTPHLSGLIHLVVWSQGPSVLEQVSEHHLSYSRLVVYTVVPISCLANHLLKNHCLPVWACQARPLWDSAGNQSTLGMED